MHKYSKTALSFPLHRGTLLACFTAGLLGTSLLGTTRTARAQHPMRLVMGVGQVRQTINDFNSYSRTERPHYLHLGVSYDVWRHAKNDKPASVFGSIYYDHSLLTDGYGGGADNGSFALVDPAYSGGGFAIRTHNSFGYVGAGLGAYRGGIGGKLFAGLQGRGSVFAELSLTRTANDPPASITTLLGIRL